MKGVAFGLMALLAHAKAQTPQCPSNTVVDKGIAVPNKRLRMGNLPSGVTHM